MTPHPEIDPAADARRALEAALYECKRVVIGQDAMLERLLVALLTGGHVLLEGVPGLAKTGAGRRPRPPARSPSPSRRRPSPCRSRRRRSCSSPDESGSMAATDVNPSRLQAAQSAARAFLGKVPDSLLVGFVGFSSQTNTVVEPTLDRDDVSAALASLRADGGTATGDALTVALDRLEARRGKDGKRAPAAVILLSDGARTAGSDPLAAALRAKQLGIPVSTVALGTAEETVVAPNGEAIPVAPDPETLRRISSITGGTFTAADEAGALEGVYKKLGSKVGVKHVKREISASFAAAGLVLLLAGLGTGLRWRARLP
jgi:Ca-activated chloride channel homolog